MEADEREPIRGRQARATRARVGRSGPLFSSSSSGSSDGEGSSAIVRPANIEFPPNLLGHYYVRDPACEEGTMMELPITETQRVPIAILPSPNSASKRASSVTPSSVATTRNLDLDLGAPSPVGSSHPQQHRYQAPAPASPTVSSAHSTTSRMSRVPPPPGYLSNSCYQLGCSPQCTIDHTSRRRTTSPRSYTMAYSPDQSARTSATSVRHKYFQQPRHSYDAGLSLAGSAGQWRTQPRGGHSPLGCLAADPTDHLADTADQLRQQLHLLHQQHHYQEACGLQQELDELGQPPRPWRQQQRVPASLPPARVEAGDVALKDLAASAVASRRARSDGSGNLSLALGLDRGRAAGPLAVLLQPQVPGREACGPHESCWHGERQVGSAYAAGAMNATGLAAVGATAPPGCGALGNSPGRAAGALRPTGVSPRGSPAPAPSVSHKVQKEEQLLRLLRESAERSSSSCERQGSPDPRHGLQPDVNLQRCSLALSELDSIAGGVAGCSVSDGGDAGSGDGVGLTVGSRTGLYDITTILRQDGAVDTVLHSARSTRGSGADSGCHAAVPCSSRSLPQSPFTATRSGGRSQHEHVDGGGGSGPSRSPPLAPSSPLRVAMNTSSGAGSGGFLTLSRSVMCDLATAAGVPVGATKAQGPASSAAPCDRDWADSIAAATTPAAGADALVSDRGNLSQRLPSWRAAEQEESPPQQMDPGLLEEETTTAVGKQQAQASELLGTPNYSYVANPLFRSYGGASGDRNPNMPDIESASPARLTDDGGAPASGTRTPPSSTRRPMLLLGGPRNSSSGGGDSRSSCVVGVEALAVDPLAAGSLIMCAMATSEDGDADEDLFSLPVPSPASLRQAHASLDGNNGSSSSSGRLSPARLLNAGASEGSQGGPSRSSGSAFACSPSRQSPTSDGMRVLDLTCLQHQHCRKYDDPVLPAAVAAALEPVARSPMADALPDAALLNPSLGPAGSVATTSLGELPSLSPCWADGIPDSAWDPFLPEPINPAALFGADDAVPLLRFPLPEPSANICATSNTTPGSLSAESLRPDGGEAAVPGLPIALLSESALGARRGSGSSVEREAVVIPAPVILAAATEVQMQGADLMAMARRMERTGDDILAAALEARRRSEDMMAAAQEVRVQSFTLIAEAVNVKMQGADMLAAARIVQLQGADLMVAAARELEDEEAMAEFEGGGEVEVHDEAVQATEAEGEVVEAAAVAPAADAVSALQEQGVEAPAAVSAAVSASGEEGFRDCGKCDGSAAPLLLPRASSDAAHIASVLWPSPELARAAAGSGTAAVAYVSFPNELTMDINAAMVPCPDDCEKAWAAASTAAVNPQGLCDEDRPSEPPLSGAGSAEAASVSSEQQGGGIWQGWAALEAAAAVTDQREPGDEAQQWQQQQQQEMEARQVEQEEAWWAQESVADWGVLTEVGRDVAADDDMLAVAAAEAAVAIMAAPAAGRAEVAEAASTVAGTSGYVAVAAVPESEAVGAVLAVAPEVTVVAPAARDLAVTGEGSLTPLEMEELMALALELSAEAMGIRAAEAMAATDGEDDALEGLARIRAAERISRRQAPAPSPAAVVQHGDAPTPAAPSVSSGLMPGAQHQELQQDEQAPPALEIPAVAREAAQGNAATARGSLTALDVAVCDDGTALLRLQPRQRCQEDVAATAVTEGEGSGSSPKGLDAAAVTASMVESPAPIAPLSPGRLTLSFAATAAAAAATTAAASSASASATRLAIAAAAPASAGRAFPVLSPRSSASAGVAHSRTSSRRANSSSPAAVFVPFPSTASTASSTRGRAKAVAAALAASQSRATAASVTPVMAVAATSVVSVAGEAPAAPLMSTAVVGPAKPPTVAAASTAAMAAAPNMVSGAAGLGVIASLGGRHHSSASCKPGSGGSNDTPAEAPGSSRSVVAVNQSAKATDIAASVAGEINQSQDFSPYLAPSPSSRSLPNVASTLRKPRPDARAITAEASNGATAVPPSGPEPGAAARGPGVAGMGTVPDPLATLEADLASDDDYDDDAASAAHGSSWLTFGSGLLASAALVCASALHLAQQQPQPEHRYQPFQPQPAPHWSTSTGMRVHVGRASGSSIDSVEGSGLVPLNASSCPAPWLLRCVPVEIDGASRRDVEAAAEPAAAATEPRDGDDGGAARSLEQAAEDGAGFMDWQAGVESGGGEQAVPEDDERSMAMASLGAAVALVSHPQYAGTGVPAWLSSDPRIVSAELEGQLFEDIAPLLVDGSEAQWGEVEEAPPAEAEAPKEENFEEAAAAEEAEENAEETAEEEDAAEEAERTVAVEAEEAEEMAAAEAVGQVEAVAGWQEVNSVPVPAAVIPTSPRRAADFWPISAAVPDATATGHGPAPATSVAAAAEPSLDAAALPLSEQPIPAGAGMYLRGAGLCLSAVVAATVSALLWAGRRRRVPRNAWMAEWKSVWDVGPIPSVPRNQYPPAGVAAGAGAGPSGLHQSSVGADNGIYDAYGAVAVAAAGAAAYAMYGNAVPYGYSASPPAHGGNMGFGGPAGPGNFQPTEYDEAYYQQHQNHHHYQNQQQYQQQQQQYQQQHNNLPTSPRRFNRDIATNAALLDCYYLRSNRLVPRGSPRSPQQRQAGGSLGAAGGMYGGGGAGSAAFAAGGGAGSPAPATPGQVDVWYHWLRNRTIFCFNQEDMSPEARRLIADQHQ